MLEIDQIARIDTKLKVGQTSDTIVVSSDVSPIMQTEDATVESTLSGNALSSMPLNGLNFQSATLYVAGAVNPSMSSMQPATATSATQARLVAPLSMATVPRPTTMFSMASRSTRP